jgi:hypothetical protein
MIQFNLLPDIKIQYLKAKRQEHAVVLGSTVAIIVSLSLFVLLIVVVHGLQKKNISDLNTDIKTASQELKNTQNLTKILSVQNQLNSLPAMHDKKAVASRLFDYLSQVTPTEATIGKLNVDYAANTMEITGGAKNLTVVNKYTDTLKFTKYTTDTVKDEKNAFTDVVLTDFSRDAQSAAYTISLKFDPTIFSSTDVVKLTVPQIISTRSEVDKPGVLFQQKPGAQ